MGRSFSYYVALVYSDTAPRYEVVKAVSRRAALSYLKHKYYGSHFKLIFKSHINSN